MTFQQIIIIGNVGGDPKLNYTAAGLPVCDFTVAVNKVSGRGETRKEETTWFRVNFWRERAETANTIIKKGAKIMVVGEVKARAYTDKNGQNVASLEITGSEFKLLSAREGGGGDYGGDEGGGGSYAPSGARGGNAPAGGRSGSGGRGSAPDPEDIGDIPF